MKNNIKYYFVSKADILFNVFVSSYNSDIYFNGSVWLKWIKSRDEQKNPSTTL